MEDADRPCQAFAGALAITLRTGASSGPPTGMTSAREPSLTIGSIFQGGYEIVSQLGAGRFGWVYKARQLSTGQDVAIKILRLLLDDTAADVENQSARFRREMRLCAGLSHPNIVKLIDSGEVMGTPCYAAPEQLRGGAPTTRSDLYSWGLIFLECLTGELAVGGGSGPDVIMRQLGPEPVSIPAWLCKRRAASTRSRCGSGSTAGAS